MNTVNRALGALLLLIVVVALVASPPLKVAHAGPPNLNDTVVAQAGLSPASGAIVCSAYGVAGASGAISSTSQKIVLKSIALTSSVAATIRITDGSSATASTSPTLAVVYCSAGSLTIVTPDMLGVTQNGGGAKTTAGNSLYLQSDGTATTVSAIVRFNVE